MLADGLENFLTALRHAQFAQGDASQTQARAVFVISALLEPRLVAVIVLPDLLFLLREIPGSLIREAHSEIKTEMLLRNKGFFVYVLIVVVPEIV